MLTVIHAADFHLDSPFSGLPPELAAQRRGEQRLFLRELTELAQATQADVVLLSGDLFDSSRVTRHSALSLIQCLSDMPCPVFIAPGNHDPYTPDSLYAAMQWPENVHIFGGNVEKVELPDKDCVVYGYGYTTAHPEVSPLEGFLVNEGRSTVKLMCLHGDLTPNSNYCPVTESQIAGSGLTYLALGHIHRCSGLMQAGNTYYAYPGCPQGRGFDETGPKGVLVLRMEPGKVLADFVPMHRCRYESVTVDVTGRDPLAAVLAALPADAGEIACRVRLVGESMGVDLPAIRAALSARCPAPELTDDTRLPADLWARREEDNLTGLFLSRMYQLYQTDPDNETIRMAARFGLAALERGEDPAP